MDLQHVPQTASMYEIKNKTADVLQKFNNGPVVLMNRATPQAVLVSPQQWDKIVDQLAAMRRNIEALEALQDDEWVDAEEVDLQFAKMGIE